MASGDLTDAEWELIGPLLATGRGRPGHESRRHLDGILWRAREGARWRAIPERYGERGTVRRRLARRRALGPLAAVFPALGRSRGGFSTKLHPRCDARGLPLAVVLTPGQARETRAFDMLVEDLAPGTRCLIGDTGYDADRAREALLLRGVLPVIPANPVRKEPARSTARCTGCATGSSGW